jgi:hypothetical protein
MNQDNKKKLTLTVTTVQTLETKAAPSYEATSTYKSHKYSVCPTGQVAAVAYY